MYAKQKKNVAILCWNMVFLTGWIRPGACRDWSSVIGFNSNIPMSSIWECPSYHIAPSSLFIPVKAYSVPFAASNDWMTVAETSVFQSSLMISWLLPKYFCKKQRHALIGLLQRSKLIYPEPCPDWSPLGVKYSLSSTQILHLQGQIIAWAMPKMGSFSRQIQLE